MNSLPFQELSAMVLLNRLMGGSLRGLQALLREGIKPSVIVGRMSGEDLLGKKEALAKTLTVFDPEGEINACSKKGIRLVTCFDEDYPGSLKTIFDPPLLFYLRGEILPDDGAAVAIVGSRHPSFYGMTQAKCFSRELSEAGLTVVSGLARGIDHIAHESALEISYGRSIAVMGSGLDRVYPRESQKLYDRLAERGAIISEYALGTEPYARNFPVRNRIISGLALGVLVVEAHSRSGSLITAHEAAEQGREVFAVPGPVDQMTSRGTNHLIKEGAHLVENGQDVIEVLALNLRLNINAAFKSEIKTGEATPVPDGIVTKNPQESLQALDGEERQIMDCLSSGAKGYDEIALDHDMAFGRKAAILMRLELSKKIQKNKDGRFTLYGSVISGS